MATLSRIWQPCISVKIGGDQDFSDFISFDNIRCLDDIKHISDDFPSPRGAGVAVGRGGARGISVEIGGDQDFSDFILFDNIRCLDDIKYILDFFLPFKWFKGLVMVHHILPRNTCFS